MSPMAMSLPDDSTMIRALMRLEMLVMVWRVLRVVEPVAPLVPDFLTGGMSPDDYIHCHITQKQDWIDLYAKPFFFGCEADDRANAWAFKHGANPFNARLNAIFGSDIGHFDVPDMMEVLPEAHELVEKGFMAAADFRDFTFANAVRLWGAGNPKFFEGTAVAKAAAAVLAGG